MRRFVRLSIGVFVTETQLVVLKSEFCCRTKSFEGRIQEMVASAPETVRLNNGAGTDWDA